MKIKIDEIAKILKICVPTIRTYLCRPEFKHIKNEKFYEVSYEDLTTLKSLIRREKEKDESKIIKQIK